MQFLSTYFLRKRNKKKKKKWLFNCSMREKNDENSRQKEREYVCVYKMNKGGEQAGERKETEEHKKRRELSLASPNRTYKQRKRRRTKRNALTVWMCVEKYQRRKRKDTWWHRSEREESYGSETEREASVHVDLSLPICFFPLRFCTSE